MEKSSRKEIWTSLEKDVVEGFWSEKPILDGLIRFINNWNWFESERTDSNFHQSGSNLTIGSNLVKVFSFVITGSKLIKSVLWSLNRFKNYYNGLESVKNQLKCVLIGLKLTESDKFVLSISKLTESVKTCINRFQTDSTSLNCWQQERSTTVQNFMFKSVSIKFQLHHKLHKSAFNNLQFISFRASFNNPQLICVHSTRLISKLRNDLFSSRRKKMFAQFNRAKSYN